MVVVVVAPPLQQAVTYHPRMNEIFEDGGVDLPFPLPPTIVLFARFATKQDTWP